MTEWEIKKLGDVCDIKGGKRLPLGSDFSSTGYAYVRARDVGGGRVTFEEPVYIDEKLRAILHRYRVATDDICITIVGANIGDVGIIPPHLNDANMTENVAKLTNYNGVSPHFLNYYLQSGNVRELMQIFASGAAQGKLGLYKIKELPIPVPPLPVQQKIAGILSAYDDLIENNTRRISLLERMAEEVYREWFVRLRFPGHERVPTHNGVPEGWEIVRLDAVVELAYGKALKDEDRIPGEYPVCGSSGIVGTHNQCLVKSPGIVIGRKGKVGSVHWMDADFYPIDTVYYVKSDLSLYYLFYVMQSLNFLNNDAAVPGLNRMQAYSNNLFLPPALLLEQFHNYASNIFNVKANLAETNKVLKQSRDMLLPRLLSGKVTV